ncbi:hypothetical protein ACHHYP_01895 [Achlya hypogyna]|uniref:Uncharacterized protein n=1 Tax=Achlya hypogyna TaxID=1202772 RepID=A0A1V9Z7S7_ACHHY|nr:hypothetical protein ACHHYP_01895 [Achlya hypogyna]
MTSSRVLVLGDARVGKKHVVEALVASSGTAAEWSKTDDTLALPHTLCTKYYTAALEFVIPTNKVLPTDLDGYEAALLVWDATQKASWVYVQSTMEALSTRDHGLEVLIAVANRATAGLVFENMTDACLEHNVEHVQVHEASVALSPTDETSGIDRIIEALQCNMWASMVMLNGQPKPSVPEPQVVAEEPKAVPPPPTGPIRDQEEDFEALLHEVMSIRQDVNQNRLTDEERRARAADMAMKLWSLLGEGESSDEED